MGLLSRAVKDVIADNKYCDTLLKVFTVDLGDFDLDYYVYRGEILFSLDQVANMIDLAVATALPDVINAKDTITIGGNVFTNLRGTYLLTYGECMQYLRN